MKQACETASALEEHLGRGTAPVPGWTTALNLVAPRRRMPPRSGESSRLLAAGPDWVANQAPQELAAILEEEQRPGRQAAPLRKLASWWLAQFDSTPPQSAGRRFLDERAVNQLRKISGISQELSDRIRLLALGEPVPPVGRAAVRVGCRHAWCELESDGEEWQAWIRNWAEVAGVELWQLVGWIDEVGARWCGPQPHCEGCPLAGFLPSGGPREPET
jgi:endonuclease III